MSANLAQWVRRSAFAVVGVIHLLPLAGLLGRSTLESAYGVRLGEGQDLVILMQHRALLFGLLAALCFAAIAAPNLRLPAGIAALVSMLGFALIAGTQAHGQAIAKVMWIDIGAGLLLAVGLLVHIKTSSTA